MINVIILTFLFIIFLLVPILNIFLLFGCFTNWIGIMSRSVTQIISAIFTFHITLLRILVWLRVTILLILVIIYLIGRWFWCVRRHWRGKSFFSCHINDFSNRWTNITQICSAVIVVKYLFKGCRWALWGKLRRLRNELPFRLLLLKTWPHVYFISLFPHERSRLLFWLWNWAIHVNFICFIFSFLIRSNVKISWYPGFSDFIALKSTFGHWNSFHLGVCLRLGNTLMILNHRIRTNWFLIIALGYETLPFRFFIW